METAILVVALAAFVVVGVKHYIKKLSSGCCGASTEKEKRLPIQDVEEGHYSYAYKITVEGMHCSNCAARIENAFHAEEGMWAKADVAHACVLLRTKQPVEEGRLRQLVALAGYHATVVEPVKENSGK